MTGTRRPWSLPVRVELATDATVHFVEAGQVELRFSQNQLDRLFEIGLMQPPRTPQTDLNVPTHVSLTGDARFLVGEVDLGREVGMDVLVRGIEFVVHASLHEHRDHHVEAEAEGDQVRDSAESFREEGGRLSVMTIQEAAAQWDDLRSRVKLWDRIVLTEDGRRVALIVAWDWWSLHQHRMASLEGAYWGHWHTGEFNASGYAWDILRLLEPRDARISHEADEPGDGDDDEPRD
ncbi:hypothetical protein FA014_01090 [Cellulomonas hominis]|uniref:Uncharacterized protein n=1 Tax=Cellulomonas hominis TaxID=156981 RepID=A0A7Z8K202_9CELL|nr:hypothetical protein [Cellulomonas hominis]TKR27324.1 hypothetical protein FA014_01090 [Cellulomonas hominis]